MWEPLGSSVSVIFFKSFQRLTNYKSFRYLRLPLFSRALLLLEQKKGLL